MTIMNEMQMCNLVQYIFQLRLCVCADKPRKVLSSLRAWMSYRKKLLVIVFVFAFREQKRFLTATERIFSMNLISFFLRYIF